MKDATVCLWVLEYDIRSLAPKCASYPRSAVNKAERGKFWKGKLLAWRFCHDPELTVIKVGAIPAPNDPLTRTDGDRQIASAGMIEFLHSME